MRFAASAKAQTRGAGYGEEGCAGAGVRGWGRHVSRLIITRRLGCPPASPPYKGSGGQEAVLSP